MNQSVCFATNDKISMSLSMYGHFARLLGGCKPLESMLQGFLRVECGYNNVCRYFTMLYKREAKSVSLSARIVISTPSKLKCQMENVAQEYCLLVACRARNCK